MEHKIKDLYVSDDGIEWYKKDTCLSYERLLEVLKTEKPFTVNRESFIRVLDAIDEFSSISAVREIRRALKEGEKSGCYADRYKFYEEQFRGVPPRLKDTIKRLLLCYEFISQNGRFTG